MRIWVYTLISVTIVSLISLIGAATLSLNPQNLKKIVLHMVSFAVGALFGDALIHLLPEAFETLGVNLRTSFLVIFGLLIFFVLEKFLRWQHCHVPTSREHVHPVAVMNIVGDAAHNFMDGVIIASSFLAGIPVGITTTLAVILHEIPQEIGDFGILIHKGMSPSQALMLNFLSALTSLAGAVLTLWLGATTEHFVQYLIPVTAGGFLYIAGSDLIPELHHHGEDDKPAIAVGQFAMIVLGVLVMAALTFLE